MPNQLDVCTRPPRRRVGGRGAAFGIVAAVIALGAIRTSVRTSSLVTVFPTVEELVLDNGFRILVVTDQRVARVSASLWYRVGGVQELQNEHGSTHFLEHMVHQGTTTVGTTDFEAEKPILREIAETEQKLLQIRNRERNRLRERDVFHEDLTWPSTPEIDALRKRLYELEDRQSEYREFWSEYNWYRRYGAVAHSDPVPATTGHEQLQIDLDLPREHLELFFRLEADRMVNAVLRGWEAQRFTVLEQILGGRQQPGDPRGRFYEVINGVTGVNHNIFLRSGGHLRDFSYYTRAAMLRIYDDFFVPNNATLVLVGDVTPDNIRPLAARYFARIARGAEPPARMDLEAEVVPGGAVRLDWMEPVDDRVLIRHRIPAIGHPDRPTFDTIAALLSGTHGLIADRLHGVGPEAASIQVSANRSGSPSTFDILVLAQRAEDLPALEQAVLAVLENVRTGLVKPEALERARSAVQLDWAMTSGRRKELAGELGRFQVMDSWRTLQPYIEARERATLEDLRRTARRYLIPVNSVTVTARRVPRLTTHKRQPSTSAASHR
jgi:predicted Zn-dependent peptidase